MKNRHLAPKQAPSLDYVGRDDNEHVNYPEHWGEYRHTRDPRRVTILSEREFRDLVRLADDSWQHESGVGALSWWEYYTDPDGTEYVLDHDRQTDTTTYRMVR